MVGAVQNLMNLAADPDEGIRFCRRVAAEGTEPFRPILGDLEAGPDEAEGA